MPRCANCGTALAGHYCHECGQPRKSPITSLRVFADYLLSDVVSVDSRLFRSLRDLLLRPGLLTREYLDGRRVRYTQPLQLYLLVAAVFFFATSFHPFLRVDLVRKEVVSNLPGLAIWQGIPAAQLRAAAGQPQALALFRQHFLATVNGYLPALLAGFVLLFPLALMLLYRGAGRRYLGHMVFALHWSAFFLILVTVHQLLPAPRNPLRQGAVVLLANVYLAVALRRVYGGTRLRTIAKSFVLLLIFLVMLGFWLGSAVALGFAMA